MSQEHVVLKEEVQIGYSQWRCRDVSNGVIKIKCQNIHSLEMIIVKLLVSS